MSEKDGKDCKHEKIISGLDEYSCISYWCGNEECKKKLEVVILTKAHNQAREDVIEAGREYVRSVDNVATGETLFENLKLLQTKIKALDALKGDK